MFAWYTLIGAIRDGAGALAGRPPFSRTSLEADLDISVGTYRAVVLLNADSAVC